jgi:hypothetical protein
MAMWILLWVVPALVTVAVLVLVVGPGHIFSWLRSHRMVDPVDGELLVTASSRPSGRSRYTNYRLHGVVSVSRLAATAITHIGYARNTKWPYPGAKLPVRVDRADPSRLLIRWNQVPTGQQTAAEMTDRLARAMRGQAVPEPPFDMPTGARHPDADRIAAAVRDSLVKMGMRADRVNVETNVRTHVLGGDGVLGGSMGSWGSSAFMASAGEAATAVVTASREVPAPPGEDRPPGGAVELTLEVTRADGTRHTATAGVLFSSTERRVRYGMVGSRLPVRIDPTDADRVVIDAAAFD